jgi:predicted nucleic acid-binding protein
MTMVMVDTSVWIEYFKSKSRIDGDMLDAFILEDEVSTCLPIYAEVLSGQMNSQTRATVEDVFKVMKVYGMDLNQIQSWKTLSKIAHTAFSNRIPPCGLIDRMIVNVCKENNVKLWTLDNKLKALANFVGVANIA